MKLIEKLAQDYADELKGPIDYRKGVAYIAFRDGFAKAIEIIIDRHDDDLDWETLAEIEGLLVEDVWVEQE